MDRSAEEAVEALTAANNPPIPNWSTATIDAAARA